MIWDREVRSFEVEIDVLVIKEMLDDYEGVRFFELRSVVEDIL